MAKSGPDPADYEAVIDFVNHLDAADVPKFRQAMLPVLNPETIIGFSYTKPFGYNGDFFIIEKIYQHYVNPDPRYTKWDTFFHTLPAAVAVVNRKTLATDVISRLNASLGGKTAKVLILGSGPVTEVQEYLSRFDTPNRLHFHLVDLDPRSISYAKTKTRQFSEFLQFYHANVIRFAPVATYDLIWSAGLFDYFKDKHFVYLLRKYYAYLNPGGRMIIGNFSSDNPSRKIMEALGDWFLCHRTRDELRNFALQAGIVADHIEIITEPLGINLFLSVRKP